MRLHQLLFALACIACIGELRAAEPVTVELRDRATVGSSVVTIGEVALISGGDTTTRERIGRVDLAELKARESSVSVGRKSVEYRLILAGFDANRVRVTGAERSTISLTRRPITIEEVTTAAKTELLRHLANSADPVAIELAQPVLVKLPEVPADEQPTITVRPRGKVGAPGRVQMDVAISSGGVPLLSFAVYLEVKASARPATTFAQASAVVPASASQQPAPASNPVLIRARQRVTMEVRTGELVVRAVGEAQQDGRLGQSIQVQNVDSKKTIVARVTGPATVEVDIGGPP